MNEKPQPETLSFETLETQLVREAIRVTGELYVEEIARNAIRFYPNDKGKQSEFITHAWSHITNYELSYVLNKDNLRSMWSTLRESKSLGSTVLNTAVKLRGMYAADDWSQLISNLGAGLNILHNGEYSVMDEVATKPLASTVQPAAVLGDNVWVVPLLLLSYLPLTGMPTTLAILLRTVNEAPKAGSVT